MSGTGRPPAGLAHALARLAGRWRARAYAWRGEERVRDRLLAGRELPAASGPLLSLFVPEAPAGAEDAATWLWEGPLLGRSAAARRAIVIARVSIVPAPVRDPAVLVASRWDTAARRRVRPAGFAWPAPGEKAATLARPAPAPPALGTARPGAFGVDERTGTARFERRAVPASPPRLRPRRPPVARPFASRVRGRLSVLEPRCFAVDDAGRSAVEVAPIDPRRPPRLAPARATFTANYVDPFRGGRIARKQVRSWGEGLLARLESWHRVVIGGHADTTFRWETDVVASELDEVREQMLLRRDVKKVETEEGELGGMRGQDLGEPLIQTYSGLAFEDLQAEPFEPLKMRLAAPPPPVEPLIEGPVGDLAWLAKAVREHAEPPPEPALPGSAGG